MSSENFDFESSGYTLDLESEMRQDSMLMPESRFDNISSIYVSPSGAFQLFSATRYGKRFILKCLKEDFRFNPLYRTALLKEFEIGISLDHPNIRNTIGFEEIDGLGPTIILEYVDGETLENLLKRKDIKEKRILSILTQLCDALEYLHSKQVFHRDLKPSNIMVTYSGNVVKLIDFSLSDSDSFMVIKIPAGTKAYMAPEQLIPEAKADVSADIYSFGTILKEIADITGNHRLLKIGKNCSRENPGDRPSSIREINLGSISETDSHTSFFYSKTATRLLIILLCAAALCVGTSLYLRYYVSDNNSEMNHPDNNRNGITVRDATLWNDKNQ